MMCRQSCNLGLSRYGQFLTLVPLNRGAQPVCDAISMTPCDGLLRIDMRPVLTDGLRLTRR